MKKVYTAVYCQNSMDCNGPILSTYESLDNAVQPLLSACRQYWKTGSFKQVFRDMDTESYLMNKDELIQALRNLDYIGIDGLGYMYIDMQTLNETHPAFLEDE